MSRVISITLILTTIIIASRPSHPANVLFIPCHNSPSHTKSFYMVGEACIRAGHNVSLLQILDHPTRKVSNTNVGVRDYIIHTIRDVENDDWYKELKPRYWHTQRTAWLLYHHLWHTMTICARVLEHESTRNAFLSVIKDTKWDAVVVDNYLPSCAVMAMNRGLLDKDSTVLVDFSITTVFPASLESRGIRTPTSIRISTIYDHPTFDSKRFGDRVRSTLSDFQISLVMTTVYSVHGFTLGRKLGLHDVRAEALYRNSRFGVIMNPNGLDYNQPRTLDMLDFDNSCPTESDPLPERFQRFVEDPASRGTILFAMGHFTDWDYAPDHVLRAFVQAFARLKEYRIVWQLVLSPDKMSKYTFPSNVVIASWIPQSALLHHPKMSLFISHMGLKSTRECMCAGVPMVGMPMYVDQYRTLSVCVHRGFAEPLDKLDLTADSVFETVKNVLDDDKYRRGVRRLRDQLNDRILDYDTFFTFQLGFFMRHNKGSTLSRYIKTKWDKLSFLTKWGNADLIIPVSFFMIGLLWIVVVS